MSFNLISFEPTKINFVSRCTLIAFLLFSGVSSLKGQSRAEFKISIDKSLVQDSTLSGTAYVVMWADTTRTDGVFAINALTRQPIFSLDVDRWNCMGELMIKKGYARDFIFPIDSIPPGKYSVTAVFDRNPNDRHFAYAEGNIYCISKIVEFKNGGTRTVSFHLNMIYEFSSFPDNNKFVTQVKFKSELLSKFYSRDYFVTGAVVLPKSYFGKKKKSYPVVYVFPDFDNDHRDALYLRQKFNSGPEKIFIVMNPSCDLGNHVFADSENNGPRATSFVKEFIPYIDASFRTSPSKRYLTGFSSGGWAALWLQVNYPDTFNGVWAAAPDPVDFRSFYRINIYSKNANAFYDSTGRLRVLERPIYGVENKPAFKQFSDFESAIFKGEQLTSHEASFGGAENNRPEKLWNRSTGKIDPRVALHWKERDISVLLQRNSVHLKNQLDNKIHIYVGTQDDFYLDESVALLEQTLKQQQILCHIYRLPGLDHSAMNGKNVFRKIEKEINESISGELSKK